MTTLPLSFAQLSVALALTIVGSAIQGSVGIGFAVIVAPILLFYAPHFVPGPIVVAALLLVVLMAIRERRSVITEDLKWATMGRVVGTIPAAYAISALPRTVYELLFGALVMSGVLVSLVGWHILPTRRNIFFASILSGFMSTVSSIGGPPMALVYQHEEGPRVRATISAIFMLGGGITLTGLWWAGKFHLQELLLGLVLMPGVVAGFWISRHTTKRLDANLVRPALLIASAICATVVVVRSLVTEF